jgi:septum formation protein
VLGSSSKWRKQVITEILGFTNVETLSPDIDEKAIRDPDPRVLTTKIANAKADALVPRVSKPCLLICSDQVILWRDQIREKPVDADEARHFLRSYDLNSPPICVDAVVITNTATGKRLQGVEIATAYFRPLSEAKIEELVAHGDVLTTAGGFVIERMQEYLDRIDGDIESVLGLPKKLTTQLLQQHQQLLEQAKQ